MYIIIAIMGRKTTKPLPNVARILKTLGQNIKLARLRRRIPAAMLAERAGMARGTLQSIERGEPGVTMGAYINVLHSLGLDNDMAQVARDEVLGRKLDELNLPVRARAPKRRTSGT